MKIETKAIKDLKPDPQNARKHDQRNLDAIKASLDKFGQRKPIVVTAEGVVLAGNGTLEAAKALGWTEITVALTPADWDYATAKAYALADNRSAELAEWDTSVLASQLVELDAEGWDIGELGFDVPEPTEPIVEDDTPLTFDDVEPITKLGDVYKLGNHRLMCGDSTDVATVAKLMDGKLADLVFTDPPYRQDSSGGENDLIGKAINKTTDSISEMIDFEPEPFLTGLPALFSKNAMNVYIFCNKDLVPDYLNWAIANKYAFNLLFWKKPNALPLASSHRPDVEYLVFIRKNAIWNNSLSNVNYSKCLEFGRENSTPHPTMKPLELIANELKISSNVNSIVVDLYGGSGSTLIACEQTNRQARLIELDPKYCDVIVKRWEALTGKKAELLND